MAKKELVPQTVAKTLQGVEDELIRLKSQYEAFVKPLEAKSKEIRLSLLDSMRKHRIKTIKIEDGTVFARVPKTTFEVVDEGQAFLWGTDNGCLRLDKIKANKILTKTVVMPSGFEQVETEHLTIKRAQENG